MQMRVNVIQKSLQRACPPSKALVYVKTKISVLQLAFQSDSLGKQFYL